MYIYTIGKHKHFFGAESLYVFFSRAYIESHIQKTYSLLLPIQFSVNGNNNSSNAAHNIRPTGNYEVDHRNLMASLENNPNVPRNCTITRPPPITRPGR